MVYSNKSRLKLIRLIIFGVTMGFNKMGGRTSCIILDMMKVILLRFIRRYLLQKMMWIVLIVQLQITKAH